MRQGSTNGRVLPPWWTRSTLDSWQHNTTLSLSNFQPNGSQKPADLKFCRPDFSALLRPEMNSFGCDVSINVNDRSYHLHSSVLSLNNITTEDLTMALSHVQVPERPLSLFFDSLYGYEASNLLHDMAAGVSVSEIYASHVALVSTLQAQRPDNLFRLFIDSMAYLTLEELIDVFIYVWKCCDGHRQLLNYVVTHLRGFRFKLSDFPQLASSCCTNDPVKTTIFLEYIQLMGNDDPMEPDTRPYSANLDSFQYDLFRRRLIEWWKSDEMVFTYEDVMEGGLDDPAMVFLYIDFDTSNVPTITKDDPTSRKRPPKQGEVSISMDLDDVDTDVELGEAEETESPVGRVSVALMSQLHKDLDRSRQLAIARTVKAEEDEDDSWMPPEDDEQGAEDDVDTDHLVYQVYSWILFAKWSYFRRCVEFGGVEAQTNHFALPPWFPHSLLRLLLGYLCTGLLNQQEMSIMDAKFILDNGVEFGWMNIDGEFEQGWSIFVSAAYDIVYPSIQISNCFKLIAAHCEMDTPLDNPHYAACREYAINNFPQMLVQEPRAYVTLPPLMAGCLSQSAAAKSVNYPFPLSPPEHPSRPPSKRIQAAQKLTIRSRGVPNMQGE